jgi:hypothetical protein
MIPVKWYQDYDGTFDWIFALIIITGFLMVVSISFLFWGAAHVTKEKCEARGLEAYEMRGYFCVDTEGRLYRP